jgi:hypothetical protein
MHIINQTIIMVDIRIHYGVVEITDYSFFTIEQFCLDFENLNILCLRAGDLSRLIRPHSFCDKPCGVRTSARVVLSIFFIHTCNDLFVSLLIYDPLKIFFYLYKDVMGLYLDLCSALRAFEQGGTFIVALCCDTEH